MVARVQLRAEAAVETTAAKDTSSSDACHSGTEQPTPLTPGSLEQQIQDLQREVSELRVAKVLQQDLLRVSWCLI